MPNELKAQAEQRRREAQAAADRLEARATVSRANVVPGPRAFVIDAAEITCIEDLQKELYAQGLGPDWHAVGARLMDLLDELGPFTLQIHNDSEIWRNLPGGFVCSLTEHPNRT